MRDLARYFFATISLVIVISIPAKACEDGVYAIRFNSFSHYLYVFNPQERTLDGVGTFPRSYNLRGLGYDNESNSLYTIRQTYTEERGDEFTLLKVNCSDASVEFGPRLVDETGSTPFLFRNLTSNPSGGLFTIIRLPRPDGTGFWTALATINVNTGQVEVVRIFDDSGIISVGIIAYDQDADQLVIQAYTDSGTNRFFLLNPYTYSIESAPAPSIIGYQYIAWDPNSTYFLGGRGGGTGITYDYIAPSSENYFVENLGTMLGNGSQGAKGLEGAVFSPQPPGSDEFSAKPTVIDFGEVLVAQTEQRSISIQNLTTSTITIELTSTAPFAISSITDLSLAAGESSVVDVDFSPSATGGFQGVLSVSTTRQTTDIALSGTGVIDPVADSDSDGIPDYWEIEYKLDPNDPTDAVGDFDEDGLLNIDEYKNGTHPRVADTDKDGLSDGEEVAQGTDPLARTPYISNTTYTVCTAEALERGIVVVVSGKNFGETVGASSLYFGGLSNEVIDWNDHQLSTRVELPEGLMPGEVDLQVRTPADDSPVIHAFLDSLVEDDDGDGLLNGWEMIGIDNDCNGAMQSPEDLDLPGLGADRFRKDIFLQIDWMRDWMEGGVLHHHKPTDDAIDYLKEAFAKSPEGIHLYVDVSARHIGHEESTYLDTESDPNGSDPASVSRFDEIKAASFPKAREYAFRYALMAHQLRIAGGTVDNQGRAELPGNDFIVTLKDFHPVGAAKDCAEVKAELKQSCITDVVSRRQAAIIMHELGHTLNLRHGGIDDINGKPNYLSIMNYLFTNSWIPVAPNAIGEPSEFILDFSTRVDLPVLNENYLREDQPILKGREISYYFCDDGSAPQEDPPTRKDVNKSRRVIWGSMQIDWDCKDGISTVDVASDITGKQQIEDGTYAYQRDTLVPWTDIDPTGQPELKTDWESLVFNFQATEGFADGSYLSLVDVADEPTVEDLVSPDVPIGIIPVQIDVKPNDQVNAVSLNSRGVVPVAILSNLNFDVKSVRVDTVTFANSDQIAHEGHYEDVNGDGLLDLLLHFETQSVTTLSGGSTSVTVTGMTRDRYFLTGQDSIKVIQ